jgi:hypothetical protein
MSNGKRRFPARSEAESSEPSEDRTGASVAETPESSALAHPGGNGKRRLAARSSDLGALAAPRVPRT